MWMNGAGMEGEGLGMACGEVSRFRWVVRVGPYSAAVDRWCAGPHGGQGVSACRVVRKDGGFGLETVSIATISSGGPSARTARPEIRTTPSTRTPYAARTDDR